MVDADVIARQVVEPGTPALKKIKTTFGTEVIFPDGTLDRKKLGSIIFTDEAKRKKLNKIVHPAVRKAMLWQVLGYWIRGYKYCIMDVPLLIEGGLYQFVGLIVVVYWCVADYLSFEIRWLTPLSHLVQTSYNFSGSCSEMALLEKMPPRGSVRSSPSRRKSPTLIS